MTNFNGYRTIAVLSVRLQICKGSLIIKQVNNREKGKRKNRYLFDFLVKNAALIPILPGLNCLNGLMERGMLLELVGLLPLLAG